MAWFCHQSVVVENKVEPNKNQTILDNQRKTIGESHILKFLPLEDKDNASLFKELAFLSLQYVNNIYVVLASSISLYFCEKSQF